MLEVKEFTASDLAEPQRHHAVLDRCLVHVRRRVPGNQLFHKGLDSSVVPSTRQLDGVVSLFVSLEQVCHSSDAPLSVPLVFPCRVSGHTNTTGGHPGAQVLILKDTSLVGVGLHWPLVHSIPTLLLFHYRRDLTGQFSVLGL